METKQALEAEKKALMEKLIPLGKFLTTDEFQNLEEVDRILINVQLSYMMGYETAIRGRINRMK